eukprot:5816404-Alexandrium_andersonii.AAC.1
MEGCEGLPRLCPSCHHQLYILVLGLRMGPPRPREDSPLRPDPPRGYDTRAPAFVMRGPQRPRSCSGGRFPRPPARCLGCFGEIEVLIAVFFL